MGSPHEPVAGVRDCGQDYVGWRRGPARRVDGVARTVCNHTLHPFGDDLVPLIPQQNILKNRFTPRPIPLVPTKWTHATFIDRFLFPLPLPFYLYHLQAKNLIIDDACSI
jgi:hypothetical protein